MKVRMLTLSAGPKGSRHPGQVVEVSAKEGKELCELGYAEVIAEKESAKAETRDGEKLPEKEDEKSSGKSDKGS